MRFRSMVGDLVGLGTIAALLLKLSATAVLAVNIVTAEAGNQVVGPLDRVLYREVVCPNRIRAEAIGPANFAQGVSQYFFKTGKKRADTPTCERDNAPKRGAGLLNNDVRLVLAYLAATGLALALVLLTMRALRRNGYPPAFEALCERLELDVRYARAPAAPQGDNGSSALAVAGGVATLLGIATGGLGLMVAGPLLLAAAGKTDEAKSKADAAAESSEDVHRAVLTRIIEARRDFLREREMFLTTAFAVAVGLVAGNYVALGLMRLLERLDRFLRWEAWGVGLLAAVFGVAALFPPRRLGPTGRYWFSLGAAWLSAVLAVALIAWLHDHSRCDGIYAAALRCKP